MSKINSVVSDLYCGKISPFENCHPTSAEAEKALKRRTDAEVELSNRLKGEELELLNEMLDAFIEYEDYSFEAMFANGLHIGIGLAR